MGRLVVRTVWSILPLPATSSAPNGTPGIPVARVLLLYTVMELTFCARPVGAEKWKVSTPVGKYIITQEENGLGYVCYSVDSPVGRRVETEVETLDEAEQIVTNHYHKHYAG